MSRKPLQHSQSLAMAIEEQRQRPIPARYSPGRRRNSPDELKNLAALESEKAGISTDLALTRANLLALTKLYDRLEGEERDIDVLIRASRDAVHALRSEGIEVPVEAPLSAPTPADAVISEGMRAALAPALWRRANERGGSHRPAQPPDAAHSPAAAARARGARRVDALGNRAVRISTGP